MDFKPLPVGIDSFERMINDGYYYVDKTLLIKELLDYKGGVNLFTRPRRFGKTLNMSMIQYFFEKRRNDNSYLFEGLKIMEQGEEYTNHMGQYPVINLSLKSAKQPDFDFAYTMIARRISEEFKRHEYILDDERLSNEKEKYINLAYEKGSRKEYADSLFYLSQCLEKYHEKKVIILIDEYDVPLENSYFEGFYDQMIKFIRSLFESSLKTNDSLEFAVITGCLRISKESIFTGLNNLEIISILNQYYSEHFGFTHQEVHKMLNDFGLSSRETLVNEWYDGYKFGDSNVYNPWSVIKVVKDLYKNINTLPVSYWANTSSNSIVRSLIEKADLSTKLEIEELIAGGTIEKPIHEDITYDEIYKNMDNLWNFMFFTGYLKKVGERIDETNQIHLSLKIPNEEVRYIFRYKVLDWFNEKIKVKDLSVMYDAIIDGDVEIFQKQLRKLLMDTISFNDAYENFYHGFLVGVLTNISDFIIRSNYKEAPRQESEVGFHTKLDSSPSVQCQGRSGRSDIYIKSPSVLEPAIIIELKVASNIKELSQKCDEALKQIEEKEYDKELQTEGYEDIRKYGIAFYRKDCLIKKS